MCTRNVELHLSIYVSREAFNIRIPFKSFFFDEKVYPVYFERFFFSRGTKKIIKENWKSPGLRHEGLISYRELNHCVKCSNQRSE